MQFKDFSIYLQQLEQTPSRNEMTVLLSDLFDKLEKGEVKPAMYLMQGRLVPKYVAVEFNFSNKLVLRSLSDFVEINRDPAHVKELFARLGDAGLVSAEVLSERGNKKSEKMGLDFEGKVDGARHEKTNRNDNPTIVEVYTHLLGMAKLQGKGSQDEKIKSFANLILSLDPLSARYASRIIVGNLRLGLSEKTVLDSLSWYAVGDKSLRSKIDLAFGARADIGELVELVIEAKKRNDIINALENISVEVGTPIAAKLVERESNSENVWKRMPNCFAQPKLDGLRGQIHFTKSPQVNAAALVEQEKANGATHIFSRNMEDMTEQFPELTDDVAKLNVESIILDSEIMGFDQARGSYFTYQETMQRKRKYDISSYAKDIPVKAFCFDIIYLNGSDLTQKPIEERLKILKNILVDPSSSLVMLETKKIGSVDELESYFKEQVEDNHLEGIITKGAGSTYEPGTRNFKWIKLKANTRSDLVDTIDVVVMGYYHGKGTRTKFKVGTLLTGVYNPKDDRFYSIGKVGSGFSEEDLKVIYQDLENIKVAEIPEQYVVNKTLTPDVWVEPKIIMEVTADEITRSPVHTAAIGIGAKVRGDDPDKGLSIRFPRMKIWKRDKELPNTVDEIVRMYELRKGKSI